MFNLEIENKIINFIKKSPLGVTSSEIANYIGFNRMTITKYLAIIKERTLIDFKRFGMAKLWYIPINLNQESFLNKLTDEIIKNMPETEFKAISKRVGISLGKYINNMYLNFNGVEKLTIDQLSDAYEDIGRKIGGIFKARLLADRISVEIVRSPFEKGSIKLMNRVLSAIFAKMSALNIGYGKSAISKPNESSNVMINVHIKNPLKMGIRKQQK